MQLTAVLCHSLSCSLPGQGVVQLVSAGNVCLNVYSALCLCWKRKDQSMCLRFKMEAVWLGTSSHSQSPGCTCTYTYVPCPPSLLEPRTGDRKSSCSFRWPSEVRAAFQGKWTQPYLWPISCLQWGETQDQVMIVTALGQNKALSSLVSRLQQRSTGSIGA